MQNKSKRSKLGVLFLGLAALSNCYVDLVQSRPYIAKQLYNTNPYPSHHTHTHSSTSYIDPSRIVTGSDSSTYYNPSSTNTYYTPSTTSTYYNPAYDYNYYKDKDYYYIKDPNYYNDNYFTYLNDISDRIVDPFDRQYYDLYKNYESKGYRSKDDYYRLLTRIAPVYDPVLDNDDYFEYKNKKYSRKRRYFGEHFKRGHHNVGSSYTYPNLRDHGYGSSYGSSYGAILSIIE